METIEIPLPNHLMGNGYVSATTNRPIGSNLVNHPVILKRHIRQWLRANVGVDGHDYFTATKVTLRRGAEGAHKKPIGSMGYGQPVIEFIRQSDSVLFKMTWL